MAASRCPGTLASTSTRATIDTVVVAFTDMQGRLQGKRLHARFFLDEVLEHGTEGCNYLLAVDVDMNTVDGYAMSPGSAATATSIRARPGHPAPRCPGSPAPRWCCATWPGSTARRRSSQSPRQILRGQLDRAGRARATSRSPAPSWSSSSSTTPTRQAWDAGYRDLTPANQYNVDYSLLGTAAGSSRCCAASATRWPAPGSSSSRRRASATSASTRSPSGTTRRCAPRDNHAIYKNGAKEIAAQDGMSLTFMAKSTSARATPATSTSPCAAPTARIVFDDGPGADPTAVRAASSPACWPRMREFTLLYAPNINSYKRFQPGSFAPDRGAPGATTTAPARCGSSATAPALRLENRVPGGDVNPYLAIAGDARRRRCTASSTG